MKLNDYTLVQWQDAHRCWQRGRVQLASGKVVTADGLRAAPFAGNDLVLVKHSCDGGLEFVRGDALQVQEEHSDG